MKITQAIQGSYPSQRVGFFAGLEGLCHSPPFGDHSRAVFLKALYNGPHDDLEEQEHQRFPTKGNLFPQTFGFPFSSRLFGGSLFCDQVEVPGAGAVGDLPTAAQPSGAAPGFPGAPRGQMHRPLLTSLLARPGEREVCLPVCGCCLPFFCLYVCVCVCLLPVCVSLFLLKQKKKLSLEIRICVCVLCSFPKRTKHLSNMEGVEF